MDSNVEETITSTRFDLEYDDQTTNYGIISSDRYNRTFLILKEDIYFNLLVSKDNAEIDYDRIEKLGYKLMTYCSIAFNAAYSIYKKDDEWFRGEFPFIQMDFIPGVYLSDILNVCKKHKRHLKPYYKYLILLGIAKGLADLHSKCGLIHREIIPANILIDPDFHPHLGDFSCTSSSTITVNIHGQDNFCPPEACRRDQIEATTKYDVYTFGGTIFQMITNHEPFEDAEYTSPLQQATSKGIVDQRFQDEILPEDKPLYEIVQNNCWKFKPEDRIDMDTLGHWLLQGAQLNVKDKNEFENIAIYLQSISPQNYPVHHGTPEKIQKAVDNGFYGIEQSRPTFFHEDGIMKFLANNGIIAPITTPEEDVQIFLSKFTI